MSLRTQHFSPNNPASRLRSQAPAFSLSNSSDFYSALSPSPIHFGGGGFSEAANVTAREIKRVNPIKFRTAADRLAKFFDSPKVKSRITREVDFLNMSLPDWMNRLMLIFCLYIPQAYTSIKKDQHKWETSGRNVITWFMSIGIFLLMKYDRFSINTLLDNFMRPQSNPYDRVVDNLKRAQDHLAHLKNGALKQKPAQGAEWSFRQRLQNRLGMGQNPVRLTIEQRQANKNYRRTLKLANQLEKKLIPKLSASQKTLESRFGTVDKARQYPGNAMYRFINRMRLPMNYYDLIKNPNVGVRVKPDSYYRAFWANLDALDMELIFKRMEKLKTQQKASTLSNVEALELKSLKQFMRRLSNFKYLSFAGASALSVTLGGYILMWSVFKLIAPLDHDFDPDRMPAKLKKQIREHNEKSAEKTAETPETQHPFQLKQKGVPQ